MIRWMQVALEQELGLHRTRGGGGGGDSGDGDGIGDGTEKKSGDDGIEMAAFTGSLFGPPLPQAPWSTPSAIAPCPAWQIWRP